MKRIIIALAATIAISTALTSCQTDNNTDKTLEALQSYVDLQNTPGIYTHENGKGKAIYAFDRNDGQGYFNSSKLTYRIMNNDANKYIQFTLSEAPTVGESVDVKVASSGIRGVSSNTTYKAMKVERIENNLCYLLGGADTKYTAIILAWID